MVSLESSRKTSLYWLGALLFFFVPALILVGLDFNYSNPAYASLDQKFSHLPTIRYMANHWNERIDYTHFISRSAPGYYLLLGAADHWITDSVVGLRFINLLITAALVAVFTYSLRSLYRAPLVVLLAAPFLFADSIYTRGLWISTDNLAWLFVVAIILVAVRSPMNGTAITAAAAFVPAAVSVRQIHAWTIPFLLLTAFVTGGIRRAFLMAGAMVPALLLIAYFLVTWGGLEPPGSQAGYSGFTLAPFPMSFSLFGVFGTFYAVALWPEIRECKRADNPAARRFPLYGVAAGALAGLIPHTDYHPFRRQSGIWILARHTPVFSGHSPAIVLLSMYGGLVGGLFFLALSRRDRMIFGAALLCFAGVHCFNTSIFERYYEPFILIVLSFATARVLAASTVLANLKVRAAGPAMLSVIQIGITIWRLSTPMHH